MWRKPVKIGLIGIVFAACGLLAFREYRFWGDLRLCSDEWAAHFDYDRGVLIMDDYSIAHQAFPMKRCGANIPFNHCFNSLLSFVDPIVIKNQNKNINLKFKMTKNKKHYILNLDENKDKINFNNIMIIFSINGKLLELSAIEEIQDLSKTIYKRRNFYPCGFPLIRLDYGL